MEMMKKENNQEEVVYVPAPVDTSDITLPEDIMELSELLAKNTHEVWSMGRIKEGWKYGKERDDVRKLHPDLLPYEALEEGEKEYDRNTAVETLKLIIKLGYEIRKNE